jgi:MMP 1-O-methyltransferase
MVTQEDVLKVTDLIDGWCWPDEGKFLMKCASECQKGSVIVEIGSWKGKSTTWLIAGSGNTPVYSIDHFNGSEEHQTPGKTLDVYPEFIENVENATKKLSIENYDLRVIRKASSEAYKEYSNVINAIGVLFIDGSHDFESVWSDVSLWVPRVVSGGVVIMHDMDWTAPRAIAEGVSRLLKVQLNFISDGFTGYWVMP